jgi:hypothetical protein
MIFYIKKYKELADSVVQAYNPRTPEAEAGES